jgi:hypothetical protein
MKKALDHEALRREALFWATIKDAAAHDPGKSCLK